MAKWANRILECSFMVVGGWKVAVVCIVGGLVYGWTNAQKRRWSLMWILLGLARISLDWFVGGGGESLKEL